MVRHGLGVVGVLALLVRCGLLVGSRVLLLDVLRLWLVLRLVLRLVVLGRLLLGVLLWGCLALQRGLVRVLLVGLRGLLVLRLRLRL
ncbi:hypothetical protein, partial [Streptomyces angustmyceticus]|uniref:hypothetical protein n=1 Tax=Streptomyces angustmyceticus TaxID=285578 RepID=UPI001ABFEB91